MESVIRATLVYAFLLLVFRISGKRSVATITTFDFVLILIIAETTQQALLGEDFSLVNCFLLVTTLLSLEIVLSIWKRKHPRVDRVLDGVPLVLVREGEFLEERMRRCHINSDDILTAARINQGLESVAQIKYAVLERSGDISIIPSSAQT